MKDYSPAEIRNLAVVGHATVGKTSLSEAMLYSAGETNRLGTVEDGTTVSDYNADEMERKISINASLLHCEWRNTKVNILDSPGYSDFVGEVQGALRIADTAVVIVNAVSGVEVGTEAVWQNAEAYKTPRLLFVNRMDKEHADFNRTVSMARERFGNKVIPVQLPVHPGDGFHSFIDLVKMQLVVYETSGSGKCKTKNIPEDLQARAEEMHEQLVEMAAENDDELLEKFFEEGTLAADELKRGLQAGIVNGTIVPVLCGSAELNVGARHLLDFSVDYLPSPQDRPAEIAKKTGSEDEVEKPCDTKSPLAMLVFKTVSEKHIGELSFFKVVSGQIRGGSEVFNVSRKANEKIDQIYIMNGKDRKEVSSVNAGDIAATVKLKDTHTGNTLCDKKHQVILEEIKFPSPVIRIAIQPKAKGDEQKISTGLHTLHEQDPTFIAAYDPELRQTIISGQGEMHLDIVVRRLKEKFGVDVELVEPRIPYRETVKGRAEIQGKYKKQSGGRGQYGDVWIKLEPMPRGDGFEFVDAIVGGVIPGKFIPAVEKGIRETMEDGAIAGYHVQDVRVTLYDGSYHNVDSSEMAFKVAGSMAFKKAFMQAKPILLEPIYDVEVVVPEEYMGDVMGDLSSRRGKISGMDSEGHFQNVKAKVPLAELYKYSTTLRSLTHGRGLHRRKFSHYDEVPHDIMRKLIEEAQKED